MLRRESLYLAALILLLLLSAAERCLIHRSASINGSIGSLISVSERQRLLAERSSLIALSLISSRDSDISKHFKDELALIAGDMDRNHDSLIHGDPDLRLTGELSIESRKILFEEPNGLDGRLDDFVAAARNLAADHAEIDPGNEYVVTLMAGSRKLVADLGTIVDLEIGEFELASGRLERLELLLTMWCLGLILALVAVCARLPRGRPLLRISFPGAPAPHEGHSG